jgi:hypothetical protein
MSRSGESDVSAGRGAQATTVTVERNCLALRDPFTDLLLGEQGIAARACSDGGWPGAWLVLVHCGSLTVKHRFAG